MPTRGDIARQVHYPDSVADADIVLPIKRKHRRRPEESLQAQCIRYLRRLNHDSGDRVRYAVVQGERVAAKSTPWQRDRLKAMGILGNAGVPELIVIDIRHRMPDEPRIWFIELKSPKGRVSQEQIDWQQWLRDQGLRYGLVRSLGELVELVG